MEHFKLQYVMPYQGITMLRLQLII